MVPTFIDIDNDGLLDFFTGNMIGTVTYYRNIGFNNGVPEFEHITDIWEDLYIVGPSFSRHGASAITFIDIDNDSDYDLAWGDYFQQSVYIIINIGTPNSPDMDNVNIIGQFPRLNKVKQFFNLISYDGISNCYGKYFEPRVDNLLRYQKKELESSISRYLMIVDLVTQWNGKILFIPEIIMVLK